MGTRKRMWPKACGGHMAPDDRQEGGDKMKLVKKLTVAVGSLLALALAGGAHWRF